MLPKALVAASLRPIILSILSDGDTYGYDIIQRIHTLSGGKIQWTAGTLYPVLHRLETRGLIEAVWRPSESGPRRKYYRLTGDGVRALEAEKRHWLDLNAILVKLWGPEVAFG
jgi:DNA-binding PadR family transcriptional regulator